jgi:hypothetical protein
LAARATVEGEWPSYTSSRERAARVLAPDIEASKKHTVLPRENSWYKCEALACTYYEEWRLREGRTYVHL